MALDDLLKRHNFTQHPFQTWTAENEPERELGQWFISPPFYDDVLGRVGAGPIRPTSHVVFGSPGAGKTAIRKMAESHLLAAGPTYLIIRYTNFSRVLKAPGRPPAQRHVDEILRLGTTGLLAHWLERPDRYEGLSAEHRAELAGLVLEYYETLPPDAKHSYTSTLSPYAGRALTLLKASYRTVVEGYNGVISVLKKEKIEPTKWASPSEETESADPVARLERFWYLARAFGFEAVWVLVDSVDEHPLANSGQAIFDAMAELLMNLRILEFRDGDRQVICFKIFLTRPAEVLPLLEHANFRKDRVPIRTIEWTRRDLDLALQKRLYHYSSNSLLSFDELCDPALKGTHDKLLDAAELRPRVLFRTAYEIFAVFQRAAVPGLSKIDRDSITEGLALGGKAVFSPSTGTP